MKINDPLDVLIALVDVGALEYGDYHRVVQLEDKLDAWVARERKNCPVCQHERSGCQYHDV